MSLKHVILAALFFISGVEAFSQTIRLIPLDLFQHASPAPDKSSIAPEVSLGITRVDGVAYAINSRKVFLVGRDFQKEPALCVEDLANSLRVCVRIAAGGVLERLDMAMTLLPIHINDLKSQHRVFAEPKAIEQSRILRWLVDADYELKRITHRHCSEALQARMKGPDPLSQNGATCALIYIAPEQGIPHHQEAALQSTDGTIYKFLKVSVKLNVLTEFGYGASSLTKSPKTSHDAVLSEFATEFKKQLDDKIATDQTFRSMYNVFALFYSAQLIRDLEYQEDIHWASSHFWINEYPIPHRQVSMIKEAMPPKTYRHTFYGLPHAENEYSSKTFVQQLWGGMYIGF